MTSRSEAGTQAGPAPRAEAGCRTVLMVGTHRTTMSGIRAVVQGYREGGLFERAPITYVATHRDGNRLVKACVALAAILEFAWRLARLEKPLVHVHLSSRASFWRKAIFCLMARAARRPYLLHLHGGAFLKFYAEECGPLGRRFIRHIFANAALVLALTEGWRDKVLRMCPPARVEVLPNGVALPNRTGARAPRAAKRLLYLGLVSPAKGAHDLLEAFARIAPRHEDWTLICGGHGNVRELRALAARLGVASRVECTGWLDPHAKERELANADIFSLPSHAEGLPMSLLEAMAWSIPVVATSVGGIPQVIDSGRNGVLVPPRDLDSLAAALEQLMQSPQRREMLGAAGRRTVEQHFSRDAAIERLLQIYGRLGIAA